MEPRGKGQGCGARGGAVSQSLGGKGAGPRGGWSGAERRNGRGQEEDGAGLRGGMGGAERGWGGAERRAGLGTGWALSGPK